MKITMLGTGNALVTRCYNTCFVIDNGQDLLLVDAGGGNGVLSQLERGASVVATYTTFLSPMPIPTISWG